MEKILLLVDALNFKPETLNFTAFMARQGRGKIIALFMDDQVLDTTPSVKTIGGTAFVEEIIIDAEEQKRLERLIQHNIEAFEAACTQRGVTGAVRRHRGNPLDMVVEESRFTDVIIADAGLSFDGDKKVPSDFIVNLLKKAECPVLIAPETFRPVEEIVLAYDGSASSVFALKQFYYQFPRISDSRVIILHISKDKSGVADSTNGYFKEWLDMHFAFVSFLELTGESRDVLFEYFLEQNDHNTKLLVTGAFGRSYLSTFFKPSTAELILKAIDISVFIAHH